MTDLCCVNCHMPAEYIFRGTSLYVDCLHKAMRRDNRRYINCFSLPSEAMQGLAAVIKNLTREAKEYVNDPTLMMMNR